MFDIEDIRQARFMRFHSLPSTNNAEQLAQALAGVVEAQERRQKARKVKDERNFQRAVRHILADLLLGFEEEGNGWSFHPLSVSSFTGLNVGYKNFKKITKAWQNSSLIEMHKGRSHKGIELDGGHIVFPPGLATRYRPLPTLINLAQKHGLTDGHYKDAFVTQLPKKTIEVRAVKIKGEGKGRRIKPPQSAKFAILTEQVKLLNNFLSSFKVTGTYFRGFRRLFNEGDRDDFDYNHGGRLHHADGEGYIGLSSDKRAEMQIDGEAVIEIDINASYLTILHGLKDIPLPQREDIYDIGGLPRQVVKTWFTITFGVQKFHRSWPPAALKKLRETCPAYTAKMTAPAVQKVVLEHFPIMSDWPEAGVCWSQLMFIESEIVIGTMLELMETYNAPSFPVHDSLIVRKSDQELAMSVLSEQFKDKVGIEPRLKVK